MAAAVFATEQAARGALVETARALAPSGLNPGRAGNLSLRWHRGGRDGLLLTPTATDYATMDEDDIAWLPFVPDPPASDDDVLACPVEWFGPRRPSSEWRIHHDLQRGQPAIGAVVHVHAPFASTLACLAQVQRDGVPGFHYMIAVAGGDSIPCASYAPFGSARLSAVTLEALRERRACLLASHGMVAVGATLAAAFELALEVEWLCRVYWQALQVGGPVLPDRVRLDEALARFSQYRADPG